MINNPLSCSTQLHQDLAELVRSALQQLGTPPDRLQGFDACSTIQIDLEEGMQLNITVQDDRLWLWSLLRSSEDQLIKNSDVLLPLLSEAVAGVETGQLVLGKGDDGYELKALLDLAYICDASGFSAVIEAFYQRLQRIHQSMGG